MKVPRWHTGSSGLGGAPAPPMSAASGIACFGVSGLGGAADAGRPTRIHHERLIRLCPRPPPSLSRPQTSFFHGEYLTCFSAHTPCFFLNDICSVAHLSSLTLLRAGREDTKSTSRPNHKLSSVLSSFVCKAECAKPKKLCEKIKQEDKICVNESKRRRRFERVTKISKIIYATRLGGRLRVLVSRYGRA